MKRKIVILISVLIAAALIMGFSAPATAKSYSKNGKAVFDFRVGNAKSASTILSLIHETYKSLAAREKGMKPSVAVVFIGPSVKLISRDKTGMTEEDKKIMDEIADKIALMSKDGVRFEL